MDKQPKGCVPGQRNKSPAAGLLATASFPVRLLPATMPIPEPGTGMRRRAFFSLLGGAITIPFAARTQQGDRKRLVGLITAFSETDMRPVSAAFRERMRELGWIDGQNVTIEVRTTGGDYAKLNSDAGALVAEQADVIVAMGTPGLAATKQHTSTIPVVFTLVADPVGQRFIESLSRPGGNLTGLTNFEFTIGGKWLELLRDLDPGIVRVALITNPANANTAQFVRVIAAAAKSLGVETQTVSVRNAAEIEEAIESAGNQPKSGLIVLPDGLAVVHHELIIKLAARFRLPAVYPFRIFPANGGLVSYGLDYPDIHRHAADYVDAILRGKKPGDLPVQAPNKFELVVNLKAAKAIGLAVPPGLLVGADEVIE
jgi:putative ABC transport system substrate-binding protein